MTRFARALAVTVDSRVAHLNYGNALEGDADRSEQIRHFERAVELGPRDANAHYHLGRALELSGENEAGRRHYLVSLGLDDRQRPTRLRQCVEQSPLETNGCTRVLHHHAQ